ncbi:MAG: FliM/FliN family flagellar motor switch protein [Pseudomonadota bacterium]
MKHLRPNETFRALKVRLPKVSSARADQWTRLARRDIAGKLTLFEHEWSYEQATARNDCLGTVVSLSVGGTPMTLSLNMDLLTWLSEQMQFSEDYAVMDPDRLALVVEHFLSAELAELEEAWGQEIVLNEVRCNQAILGHAQALSVRVRGDIPEFIAMLDIESTPDAPDPIAVLENQFPKLGPRSMLDLTLEVAVYGPFSRLEWRDLGELEVGSVLFPSDSWRVTHELAYFAGWRTHVVPIRSVEEGYRADGPVRVFSEHGVHALEEKSMSERKFDDDPVHGTTTIVTVELTRQSMTFADLQELQNGSVVGLDLNAVDTVTMRADGTPIAEGRLVQLDDAIGVQVTRLL